MPIRTSVTDLCRILTGFRQKHGQEATISVNEAVGVIAFYYEKIRTVIEYQDEHLLRQQAIRRILSRRRILSSDPEGLADALLRELIRSRYLPNNAIPIREIVQVAAILSFYFKVEAALKKKGWKPKDAELLLSLASCAIDEHLSPLDSEEALCTSMYDVCESLASSARTPEESTLKKHQLAIAVYRVLLRPDIMRLRYYLLKQSVPFWATGGADHENASSEFVRLFPKIEKSIRHPLNRKFLTILRRYRLPFVALHNVLKRDPNLCEKKDALEKEIRSFCDNLIASQKKRLRLRTIHAFLYILLTKMLLGFAVEIPYDIFVLGELRVLPFWINAFFPPALLAFLTLTVRYPTQKNTDRIVQAVHQIVDPSAPSDVFLFKSQTQRKKHPLLFFLFQLLYLTFLGLSFGFVIWILALLEFSFVSGAIALIFFCLIMFFGMSLRRSIQELTILPLKVNFIISFLDQFFLPFLHVGRWLTFNIPRINVLVFLFDILIETPFQALIEITEEWFAFLKEKKEEMQ